MCRWFWSLLLLGLLSCTWAAAEAPVFAIPRLDGIAIDGQGGDWGDRGFRVDVLLPPEGLPRPFADCDARARLGWDARGLLLLVDWHDNVWLEEANANDLWRRDALELFLSPQRGSRDVCQWVIAPGLAADQPELRWHFYDARKEAALKALPAAPTVARSRTPEGCRVEVLLPWTALAIEPQVGREIGFQLLVDDADRPGKVPESRPAWFPGLDSHVKPENCQRLRLAAEAGPPVTAGAAGGWELPRLRATFVVAAAAGRSARVMAGSTLLGQADLSPDGRLQRATVILPLPPPAQSWPEVSVWVDQTPVATIPLPDLAAQRQRALDSAAVLASPFVFSGRQFPPVDLKTPVLIEGLVGSCTLRTVFYNAAGEVVTEAAQPGRYGVRVEIAAANGMTSKRFLTLYRQPEELAWNELQLKVSLELPPQLGVAPAICREQSPEIADYLKWTLKESFAQSPYSGVLLAGLAETAPGTPAVDRSNPWSRNDWWWHRQKQKTGDLVPLRYWTHLPPEARQDPQRRWPAILFLHGSGERGNDLAKVRQNGPPKLIEQGRPLPFIVIAPQCPPDQWWSVPALDALLNEALATLPIDPDRVYLTGLSMGGFGSWGLACEFPERFAAVVPICGGGDPRDAARLKDLPIWVFHGAKDSVVPVGRSREMVAALKAIGGRVRYTEDPEANHDSWSAAYASAELYDWLLHQRRGQPQQPPAKPE